MSKWSFFKGKEKEEKKEYRYVLSIDGGGMRGIIPAYVLSRMEEDLKNIFHDERPFYSHFDLISGTSTGALIAIGLTTPVEKTIFPKKNNFTHVYQNLVTGRFFKKEIEVFSGDIEELTSAKEILELYKKNGHRIFQGQKGLKNLFGPIFNDRYDPLSLEGFLYETLGDTKLAESFVPTIAIAYDTISSTPFVFSSEDDHDFFSREVARASSAAPTYFPSANLIDRKTGNALTLIDGGVVANNPALITYAEARKLYPYADKIKMLSLSTCAPKHTVDVQNTTSGAIAWASPLFKAYSEGQMALADEIASNIKDLEYTRIWTGGGMKKIRLDDCSEDAINALSQIASNAYENNKEKIHLFLENISQEPTHQEVKLKNKPNLLEADTIYKLN